MSRLDYHHGMTIVYLHHAIPWYSHLLPPWDVYEFHLLLSFILWYFALIRDAMINASLHWFDANKPIRLIYHPVIHFIDLRKPQKTKRPTKKLSTKKRIIHPTIIITSDGINSPDASSIVSSCYVMIS